MELGASLELGKREGARTGAQSRVISTINLKVLRNPKFEAGLQVIRKVYLLNQE